MQSMPLNSQFGGQRQWKQVDDRCQCVVRKSGNLLLTAGTMVAYYANILKGVRQGDRLTACVCIHNGTQGV